MKKKPIRFINNQGAEVLLPAHLTIKDLAQMGITFVGLIPKEAPPPADHRIYVSTRESP